MSRAAETCLYSRSTLKYYSILKVRVHTGQMIFFNHVFRPSEINGKKKQQHIFMHLKHVKTKTGAAQMSQTTGTSKQEHFVLKGSTVYMGLYWQQQIINGGKKTPQQQEMSLLVSTLPTTLIHFMDQQTWGFSGFHSDLHLGDDLRMLITPVQSAFPWRHIFRF